MTMCVENTPLEDHTDTLGLWVKREDMCCPGGPNFSKTRGVFAHVRSRNEDVIGVLDTDHSQGGWAVARACQVLGKRCVNFFPLRKADANFTFKQLCMGRPQWAASAELGALMTALTAGRSAILYHQSKKWLGGYGDGTGYMMPNALKLPESVEETAKEVERSRLPAARTVLVSASSGTIAAGVLRGLARVGWDGEFIVHLGYSRSQQEVIRYVYDAAGAKLRSGITVIDEGYSYADPADVGPSPPFPCNRYYDLKAFRWWLTEGRPRYGKALFWLIG